VKTTIDIPDATFRQAKSLAGSKGISLRQLVTQALESEIRGKPAASRPPPWLKLAGAFGQTPSARAETRRIQQRIDEEFEGIEPEEPA
jgi:hypothetical protein